jgi:hypothetical protein
MHQASDCTEGDNRTNPSNSGNLPVTQQIGKLVHWWVLVELTIGRPTSVDGVKRLTINLFILI